MESLAVWALRCIAALTLKDLHFLPAATEKRSSSKSEPWLNKTNTTEGMPDAPGTMGDVRATDLRQRLDEVSLIWIWCSPAMVFQARISHLGLGWPMALALAMRAFVTHSWLVAYTILISCRDFTQLMGLGLYGWCLCSASDRVLYPETSSTFP